MRPKLGCATRCRSPALSTSNRTSTEAPTMADARRIALTVGALRAGVGVALIAVPRLAGGRDASTRMLARTVGVRDFVLGAGTLIAALRGNASSWMRGGLASDAADVS